VTKKQLYSVKNTKD